MSLYRGAGGASDATDDSTVNAVAGYASSAASSASAAAASATTATNNATAAATSASQAASSTSSAATSASNAATSASNAASSASSASSSASSASTSATNASNSAGNASTYASEALGYRNTASTHATNAANSATAAAGSATSSANSAASALAIYGNTAAMEEAVADAIEAAANAQQEAQDASDSAVAAAASAAAADEHENNAAEWASQAQGSANSAASSASSAASLYGDISAVNQAVQTSTTNAAQAVTSANAAAASASSALSSANSATSSASAAAASAAGASAVVLGNEPVRPLIRPSLLLDFANTKQLDPRITFTRASTATYYDGKTFAKAEENLLVRSQEFDLASWAKTTATVTANTEAAPDGTTTADTFAATSDNATLTQSLAAVIGLDYTFSVWIKRKTGTGTVYIACQSALGYQTVAVDSTWQRFTLTRTLTSATPVVAIRLQTSGDEVYVWGAQVEQRSSVTAYTATTTQPITNYIPALRTTAAGVARFEHNPVTGESLGLEIEEQRTNLLTYSEDFGNAAWTKTRSSVTANTIVAPDGTLTGDKLVEDTTASNSHLIQQLASFTSGTSYTFSFFLKGGERTSARFQFSSTAFTNNVVWSFNTVNGVVTPIVGTAGTTAAMTNVGNGWYRCSITATATATISSSPQVVMENGGSPSYTGDGYSGIYIWGAQLEAGAFATSYIPTVASQVTRSADSAVMTGTNFSSWYRQDEGTVYAEKSVLGLRSDGGITSFLMIDDGTSGNRMQIRFGTIISGADLHVFVSGASQVDTASFAVTANAAAKYAYSYKVNDYAFTRNAAAPFTDSVATVPVVNRIVLADGATVFVGHIRKVAYYPLRVSNAQMQSLTTV